MAARIERLRPERGAKSPSESERGWGPASTEKCEPSLSSSENAGTRTMIIRRLTTLEECRQVAALEKAVWDFADAEDVIPPALLVVSIKRGGLLLGAFDDANALKGFDYSMPAAK